MPPPPTRVWRVTVSLFGTAYSMDTPDPAKIGPWLLDIVTLINLHPQQAGPVEMRVTIS